jgi:hypothetical protein
MIVCAMGLPERHIEDIYVAKMYCSSSFKRNRFVQGQIAGKSLCFCIESPTYRSVGYTQPFAFTSYAVPGGDWSKTKTFGADVAFSQLDAMATGVRAGAKTASLTGNDATVASRTACADTTTSSGSSNSDTSQSGKSATDSSSGQTSSTSQKSKQTDCPDRTVTGVDFGRFTQANVTISKLTVLYYTREMLLKMRDTGPNGALSREGQQAISKDENGWIISRCLVADSITAWRLHWLQESSKPEIRSGAAFHDPTTYGGSSQS